MQPHFTINWLAVGASVLASFALGNVWYGAIFRNAWGRAMGFTDANKPTGAEIAKGSVLNVFATFLMAFVLLHSATVWRPSVWVPGQTHRVGVSFWPYLGDFFGALGMRAVRGSLPDPGEAGVVLDQAAAKKFFGRADPVGRVLVWGSKPGQSGTIVAEVPDLPEVYGVDMGQIRLIAPAHVYVPLALAPTRSLRVVAAFRGDPGTALKLVDRAVSEQDGTVAFETRTMVQWAGARLARARLLAALLAALGAAALVVCLLGVFAVAAYTSSAREPEIAIRVALGARPRAVAQIVLRPVLVAAALGVSAGLVIVFASLRLIAGLVLSTAFATLSDATLAAAAVCAAALTAAALPCWRATRTDPSTVLRGE